METEGPLWRMRIRTLMLLVIIAGLASALSFERWKRSHDEQRASAELERAWAQSQAAMAQAQQAINARLEETGPVRMRPRDAGGATAPARSKRKERPAADVLE